MGSQTSLASLREQDPQSFEWVSFSYKRHITLWEVYIVQSDGCGLSNPVLLSCQDPVDGVGLQRTPSGEILQAALKITVKNMDFFFSLYKACLSFIVIVDVVVQTEILIVFKNVYILKKKNHGG